MASLTNQYKSSLIDIGEVSPKGFAKGNNFTAPKAHVIFPNIHPAST
jgi:hypothetical protein